jgi:hypothetical protein
MLSSLNCNCFIRPAPRYVHGSTTGGRALINIDQELEASLIKESVEQLPWNSCRGTVAVTRLKCAIAVAKEKRLVLRVAASGATIAARASASGYPEPPPAHAVSRAVFARIMRTRRSCEREGKEKKRGRKRRRRRRLSRKKTRGRHEHESRGGGREVNSRVGKGAAQRVQVALLSPRLLRLPCPPAPHIYSPLTIIFPLGKWHAIFMSARGPRPARGDPP